MPFIKKDVLNRKNRKIEHYEKEIDINKINEVLTLKFNSCKLKIIDELKSVLDQMKKETLDTKIDKSIISKFKNMQIIEDKKTIKLKATINIMYIYKQIFTNLTKNILLKEKRSLFFKKAKSNMALSHDEIVVAIGIMINPISLK